MVNLPVTIAIAEDTHQLVVGVAGAELPPECGSHENCIKRRSRLPAEAIGPSALSALSALGVRS